MSIEPTGPSDHEIKLQTEIAELRAQLEKANAKKAAKVSMKVSGKGAVSVYGLQRFPVTLYAAQWRALLDRADEIRAFIDAHKDALDWK